MQNVRKCRKMKRQELADAIGINMQSLSKIEKGETVRPLTCWKK
ncbi:helix-turn-helix domain-containing protein [Anaeromassilibacillus sp. Marseille-P3371]